MTPDPFVTDSLRSLFAAEPPLELTPYQALAVARNARRRRQRLALVGSTAGTLAVVGTTAAAAAVGFGGGTPVERTGDGGGGLVPSPTACVTPAPVPPTQLPTTRVPGPAVTLPPDPAVTPSEVPRPADTLPTQSATPGPSLPDPGGPP
ncbi:MAG TPA: hypothetical protein VGP36_06105, partial [Mycobacteriales bacterium]|nr:hypothetical protein [Mycobacteriales bacterium]